MRRAHPAGSLCWLLLLGALIATSGAQADFAICNDPGSQYDSDVAWNPNPGNDQFLVVYDHGFDIYGQRVSHWGYLQGIPFPVATGAATQRFPAVDCAGAVCLVVWVADDRYIQGQRVDSDGLPVGSTISIGDAVNSTQRFVDVAYSAGSDRYLVVWMGTSSTDIYGRVVNSDGTLFGSAFTICTAASSQNRPRVAWGSIQDEFLVIWDDSRGSTRDIYGQRVTPAGVLSGGNIGICTEATASQLRSGVTYNPDDDEFLAVWNDQRASPRQLRARRVSSVGGLPGSETLVASSLDTGSWPDVAYNDGQNLYQVVWADSGDDIWGRFLNPDASTHGTSFGICTQGNGQDDPAVAYGDAVQADEFLTTWEDGRNSGTTGWDIWGEMEAWATPTPTPMPPVPAASGVGLMVLVGMVTLALVRRR